MPCEFCAPVNFEGCKLAVLSYGHTKCNLDLLLGSTTNHPRGQGRRHLVGIWGHMVITWHSLSLPTCPKRHMTWLKIINSQRWPLHLPKHQRGRTCLFRSSSGIFKQVVFLVEGFFWWEFQRLLLVFDPKIHTTQLLPISFHENPHGSHRRGYDENTEDYNPYRK